MNSFYIEDVAGLREKLARGERDGTRIGRVWRAMKQWVAADPFDAYWHVPFVALVTQEASAMDAARQVLRSYVNSLDSRQYSSGLQFHFWCMSFPHARWSLYFQWLESLGAWEPEEEAHLKQRLLEFQFLNFFYGLRTKPEPECADNQAMSLALSNGLLGTLFDGEMAERMRVDGLRRLPDTIGGLRDSGYSGEGSTYMNHVVAPCLPFVIELLNHQRAGDLFGERLPPAGCSAEAICRMVGRLIMPGGYMLPWDHYGYITGTRACLAYAARKTGDRWYLDLLDRIDWSHEESGGWGFDDLVWSLVWYPDQQPRGRRPAITSWMEPKEGAAIVSQDEQLYLMQMWDPSEPGYPTRQHVNPNSIILAAYGVPLTLDGVQDAESCTAFDFGDTWRVIRNADFAEKRSNFGSGCGGAHNVILVDGWEGMRAFTHYPQSWLRDYDEASAMVSAEVTPIYRERWPDARQVVRRSRLCHDRFWLIEDLVEFAEEHEVTARWYLRQSAVDRPSGICIETPEGVSLQLLPIVGPDNHTQQVIQGYPRMIDGESLRVDFTQRGRSCRWLWLAWPRQTRRTIAEAADGWTVCPDAGKSLDLDAARLALRESTCRLSFTEPPQLLADVPCARRWWYSRRFELPAEEQLWLRLPADLCNAAVWVDGTAIDLAGFEPTMKLIGPNIDLSRWAGQAVEVIVRTDLATSQRRNNSQTFAAFAGHPLLLGASDETGVESASYRDGVATIQAGGRSWSVQHELLVTEVSS